MKKVRPAIPKLMEVIFDILYLLTAISLGGYLLIKADGPLGLLFGTMALVLGGGDAFHLVPRIGAAFSAQPEAFSKALARGKMITSMTMTVFYVLLWQLGLMYFGLNLWGATIAVYVLALLRILLCLDSRNNWGETTRFVKFSLYRNIPFILLGLMVMLLFGLCTKVGFMELRFMWIGILLSFAFYLPVVFCAHKNPKLGMLMLPKSCAYIWILTMGIGLA